MVTNKPQVITIISRTSGEVSRGVETFVHQISNRLIHLGVEVIVIQNGPKQAGSNYRTISLHLPASTSLFAFTMSALKKIPSQTRIIIPINGGSQALITRLYSLLTRRKLVITGHAGLGRDDFVNLWCFPDVFIAQTERQLHWAKLRQPLVNKIIIPSGVDIHLFNPAVSPIKINLPYPIILNVGALESIKRQDLLIKAAVGLSASVLIVGKGSRQEELNRLGRKYLGSKFQIRNFNHQDMPRVYAACDLLAYPCSPWESFGLAILEALASGKPVVATADPIRQELIGTAGLLVDPTDTQKFRSTLSSALNSDWKNLPRIQSLKFSWDTIAISYLNLFNHL